MASDLWQPPQPPECQGYKRAPPHLVCFIFLVLDLNTFLKGLWPLSCPVLLIALHLAFWTLLSLLN